MCNKELLVSYLYDDLHDMDRAKVEMHLRACEECREELNALRRVRIDLAAWAPPLPDLGFRLVRDRKPARPAWRAWWTPAAGLAAAATIVLAAALAIAHVEVRRGPDGVTVRTGWSASAPAGAAGAAGAGGAAGAAGAQDAAPTPVAAGVAVANRDVRLPIEQTNPDLIAGLARRIDALESAVRAAPQTRNATMLSARSSDAELIKRVREMLAQSETRQQGELALRIAQVIRDFDAQRTADLARIQQGLGRIDANMTAEAQAHRDLANYILTAGKTK